MVPLHDGEVPADERTVRGLLRVQRSDLAGLPVRRIGGGTDNTMFRVGEQLLARLPRTAQHAAALRKELTWLPRFRDRLPAMVPVPVHAGVPGPGFPLPWSLLEWIPGSEASPSAVDDWAAYGRDLAGVVAALHAVDLRGATRSGDLAGHRGGPLPPLADAVAGDLRTLRGHDDDLDLDLLDRRWRQAIRLPPSAGPHVWLHGDLKPSNVLVQDGRLHAVIDFGGLCVGAADAEHAPVWDLPATARDAYRAALDIDEPTWTRARGWAIAVGLAGLSYYRDTLPPFAEECRQRLLACAS